MPFPRFRGGYLPQTSPVVRIHPTEDVDPTEHVVQSRGQSSLRQRFVNPPGQRGCRERKRYNEDQGEDYGGERDREFEQFHGQAGLLRFFIIRFFRGSGGGAPAERGDDPRSYPGQG